MVEYANGKPLSEILGISYRDANGKVVHNADRPAVMDLDALPDVIDVYKRDLDVRAITCRSCCIRLSRCIPRAAVLRSVLSACGRRR